MIRYVIKRLLIMIPVILGIIFIVFFLSHISGDPAAAILGTGASLEDMEELRESMGLNRPFLIQFLDYLKQLFIDFDMGRSYITSMPVSQEITERLPISLKLTLISIIISVVIGIPFGIIAAVKQNSIADRLLNLLASIGAAMPAFWIALMAMIVFSLRLQLLPSSGIGTWKHWVLPSISLALSSIASLCRTTRSNMLEMIRQDYIRTARSKGISERRVICRHALKNAIIPVLTVIGVLIGVNVGNSVVLETVFGLPGIGSRLMTAIVSDDYPVVMGIVLVLSIIVCGMNLIVDIAYGFVDPRIMAQYTGGSKKKKKAHQDTSA